MSNQIQPSKVIERMDFQNIDVFGLSSQIHNKLNIISSCETLAEQSTIDFLDQSKKKKKREKKKERKKKLKQEKAQRQQQKIADLKEIMRKIYQENNTYKKYQNKLKQISQLLSQESDFLSALNSVIAGYVEKSLVQMDRNFDSFLKDEGIMGEDSMISYEQLLSERPLLFKRLMDYLYYTFIDICRAGTNVHMILNFLRSGFKSEKQEYQYEYLDRDIFEYLIENHEQFKSVIIYAFKAIIHKTKPLKRVDQQTINRTMEIFKIMRMPTEDEFNDDVLPLDSDHSTQQQQVKCSKKKRKNKKKKKTKTKQQDQYSIVCRRQQLVDLNSGIEENTAKIIEKLDQFSMKVPLDLSCQFISRLGTGGEQ